MIRFACPGCGATYSVDDSKAGKAGKCPKCQSHFQIPAPEGVPAPPPTTAAEPRATLAPSPPADPNAPIEIAPCPGCQARLSVAKSDLGIDVECPYCKTVYTAARADAQPSPSKVRVAPVVEERPSRHRDDDDNEDDDRPSRRRRRDEEEDEDDRPRKRKRRRPDIESKRIVAGILAILIGGLGVHKFFLGYTSAGIIQILLSCVGVGGIIGLVEGIIYLTKSDEEFIQTYQIGEKQWF